MRREFLRLALLVGLAFIVVSCGNSAEPTPTAIQAPEETATTAGTLSSTGPAESGSPSAVANRSGEGSPSPERVSCWLEDDRIVEGSSDVANQHWSSPPAMEIDPENSYVATLNTSAGTFKIELLPAEAPKTVNNFVCLARAGYFDNTPFHRIIAGFVIQGGDPTGTGSGGPGYRFEDEPVTLDYKKGTVAMANAGPNTNGSQFFVVLEDNTGLPKNYTIFGQVSDGLDVVEQLGQTPTKASARGEKSVPIEPVTLDSVTIEESSN